MLAWAFVAMLAVALGREATIHPVLFVAALVLGLVGFFVATRAVPLLVVATTIGLVLGSSTLPLGSIFFVGKFALMAALAATGLTWLLAPERSGRIPAGLAACFLLLIGLALFSAVYSVDPSPSVSHAISLLLLWLAVIVVFPLWLSRPVDLMSIIERIGWVAAATVPIGALLSAMGVVIGQSGGRFQGIFVDPNTLGFFFAPLLPALVLIAAQTSDRRRRRILLLPIAILSIGLALSGSRAGVLSAVVGVTVGLIAAGQTRHVQQAKRVLAVVVIGAVAAGGLLYVIHRPIRSPSAVERFNEIGTGSFRTIAWAQALPLIDERPLLGHGFATTPTLFPQNESLPGHAIFTRLHNSYLEAALELGWPAATLLLLLGVSGLVAAWSVAHRAGPWQPLGTVLVAGIAGGLVEAVFESGLLAAGGLLAFGFWLLVAAAHSIRSRSLDQPIGRHEPSARPASVLG
jgi:O-antigen ligase